MDTLIPIAMAVTVGFTHAFEADHLVAVSSLVTQRKSVALAIKDGVYWGVGHTSTIILMGGLMILGKMMFLGQVSGYMEACVGLMLFVLGLTRLNKVRLRAQGKYVEMHHIHHHHLAYSVGAVHGLAGSGAMVLLAMTTLASAWSAMAYLLVFGLGSVVGMLVATGVFSLPLSKYMINNQRLQVMLTIASAVLCLGLGIKIIVEQLSSL